MFEYKSLDDNQTGDEKHIKCLSHVLSGYQWLIDVYNVDFYVNNHWSNVPKLWANCLKEFDMKDIVNLLTTDSESHFTSVLPLSLLSLRATCGALQLSRKWKPDSEIVLPKSNFSESNEVLDAELRNSLHPNMKYEILNRKIKDKKRHEIKRLSKLTDHLLKSIDNCNTIVDCGSGQGHLSRILSLCFGYDVISIEGNEDNVLGAHNQDNNTLTSLKRYNLTNEMSQLNCPKKVNCLLQTDSLINEITQITDNYVLLGLHACGPLSTTLLDQLKRDSSAKAILLMSCCYMKIDTKTFPKSQLVKRLSLYEPSYQAKEVACHAIEKFTHKIKTNDNLDSLRVHCFRAILESLITRFAPNMRHKALKRVKIDADMNFGQYYQKAVKGLDLCIPEEELDSDYVRQCVEQQQNALVFYSLRVMMAPLVESLILLDFINYLKEDGIRAALFPLFDPIKSPRNNVLIAIK